ncbi:MAG: type II toxin-antitoxin system RelE/ParE family toxin [Gemmatimonadaceae bacterium]|nr:type II toxin-antitoxin system RelE/ParE family toxin [Gemmatimonadaceae bacterium]MCW5825419.1 type II toxin-antitoxin system RelE/ParE family toxin [Gemmatimonadaceae bacterium]
MHIIETAAFSRRAHDLLSDEEFRLLESALVRRPLAGVLIPGTHGLRKLRWALSGRGKRGGARVIYYVRTDAGRLYLLYIYAKNEREDLTLAELRDIRAYLSAEDEGD